MIENYHTRTRAAATRVVAVVRGPWSEYSFQTVAHFAWSRRFLVLMT
jgi:hypothetical protein